ncbi:MAG: hypothetical protein L6R35_002666 [Caloplaca aegaea]|nr:MAG: hypothetical protein L6R35_002666 [Caloplaca aegaea]
MSSHTVLNFSPQKIHTPASVPSPPRTKQPTLETLSLPFTTIIVSPKRSISATQTRSPVKKLKATGGRDPSPDSSFEIDLTHTTHQTRTEFLHSKHIQLPYSLVEDGKALAPPLGDWSFIASLFPNTRGAEVMPPFLIILVPTLPPKPWPLTVGGLPLRFTTDDEYVDLFDRGRCGRGPKVLQELDLHAMQRTIDINDRIFEKVIEVFRKLLNIPIRDIFWFGSFWQITTIEAVDVKKLPWRIANSAAFYLTVAEAPDRDDDPAALRRKVPVGNEDFDDDTNYAATPDALLRPGIMVSSSIYTIFDPQNEQIQEVFDSTTSGILVVNTKGELFITVATHGFKQDGLVYHPNPATGEVIGRIVEHIPHTDMSIVRLNAGLRYVNETFGITSSTTDPEEGTRVSGMAPPYPPHLRTYDFLEMNSPYTGKSEGQLLGTGIRMPDDGTNGEMNYIKHKWVCFENGHEPVDGCCGTVLVDKQGRAVGMFRFKHRSEPLCLTVSATELREYGYEICAGVQQFT